MFPPLARSRTEKFFLGPSYEGIRLRLSHEAGGVTIPNDWGIGLTAGYGLTPRWSLYASSTGGTAEHSDFGARVSLGSAQQRIRPFFNAALSVRRLQFSIYTPDPVPTTPVTSTGVAAGGGVNIHSTAAFALTVTAIVSTGKLSKLGAPEFDDLLRMHVTTTRIGLGFTWFPQASRRRAQSGGL